MAWVPVAIVAAAALAMGRPLRRALAGGDLVPADDAGGGFAWRWALDAVAGLVALHLVLLLLDAAAVPWRKRWLLAAVVAVAGGALAVAATRARRRRAEGAAASPPAPGRRTGRLARLRGWGDAVALGVLATYGALAWRLRIATPDFVYHWGLKGHRFALARGIDWAFLADPLHLTDHPDYPNLLPDLYAATALAGGRFDERAMLLWSVAFFALLVVVARESWARAEVPRPVRQAATAGLALAVGMFAVGYQLAGGADWLIALGVLIALPPLLSIRRVEGGGGSPADDLAVGVAAALAAGAKMEGLPLAAILVGVYLGLRWWTARRLQPGTLLRTAVPPLAVVAPWLAANLRYDLFQPSNAGAFDPGHLAVVLPALAEALGTREWHGAGWLVLAAPLLVAFRRARAVGLVVTLQLGFYLGVYLTAPIDPRPYVLASFPRLLFHLVPAVVVGIALLVPPHEGGGEGSGGGEERGQGEGGERELGAGDAKKRRPDVPRRVEEGGEVDHGVDAELRGDDAP